MKRFTKFANKDPHPEIPFAHDEIDGLPTRGQVVFWCIVAFFAAIAGSYFFR